MFVMKNDKGKLKLHIQDKLSCWFEQSASKHGRRTILYSEMRELARAALRQLAVTRSDSVSISQQQLGESMDMTAAIQYILTAAQSLGSQVYYKNLE